MSVNQSAETEEQRRAAETARMFENADKILKSMQTPQTIKDLPIFNGNPIKLHAFIRAVENLIPFLQTMENTPFYDMWIQSIRSKIVGEADQILEIYGTPLTWDDIKNNLITYYSDKRDPVTLTREMFQLQQVGTIEDFYGKIQNILSHLINHANIEIKDERVRNDRVETYKDNALQVFLAGIKEPIGSNVRARQTKTLKQAFDASIEEQNFQQKTGLSKITPPARPAKFPFTFQNNMPFRKQPNTSNFQPNAPRPNPTYNSRINPEPSYYLNPPNIFPRTYNSQPYNNFKQQQNYVPNIPRLPVPNKNVFAPKPFSVQQKPEPMEVDNSIRTNRVNYTNRRALIQNNPQFHIEELKNTFPESYNIQYYEQPYYESEPNYEQQVVEKTEQSSRTEVTDHLNFQMASETKHKT